MHLILTSSDFGNPKSKKCILENLKKPIEQCKVLFFPNEKATQEMIESEKYYNWMQERGFKRENTYIFDYYNPQKFTTLQIDCIHVSGGSACQTLDRIRRCNADKTITNYINQGVTYIGGSAGTHIVTKNLKHVLPFEQSVPVLFDFNGLNFFDGIIFCHYSNDRKNYYEKALEENLYKVYKLTDEEVIVISY